jgi:hypothetical protein
MNGRMYDPILGRMLRPDNFVQDPMFSQSYNRYSYAWNNPLSYTDPDGEFVVATAIIAGAIIGAYIGGSIANNSFSPSEWAWKGEDAWKTYTGIGLGAVAGAFAGKAIGAGIVGKTISAKALAGKSLSGTMNAMYNHEKGQGAFTTLGYFAAGFGGASFGLHANSLVSGMLVGGFLTSGVYAGDAYMSNEKIDNYVLAQKFASGALNTYSGMSFVNSSYGYIKIKDKYLFGSKMLSKGATYAVQNHVATFAYTDQKKYKMTTGKFFGIAGIGFLSGMSNYAISNFIDINVGNKQMSDILTRGAKVTAGFFNYWALDYSYTHNLIYGDYYGYASQYKYKGQKAGIGTIKNIFLHLMFKK